MNLALKNVSKEQRQEWLAKAQEARKLKKEAGQNLFHDFGDDLTHWRELASKHNVKLPAYYLDGSNTKYLKRLFKSVDIDINLWLDDQNMKLTDFYKLNPSWPVYAHVGCALEWIDEQKMINILQEITL